MNYEELAALVTDEELKKYIDCREGTVIRVKWLNSFTRKAVLKKISDLGYQNDFGAKMNSTKYMLIKLSKPNWED